MKDLKEILGEELFNQISTHLGDNANKLVYVQDGNWIPKAKFNEVNDSVKELKTQIKERDKQLEDLSSKVQEGDSLKTEIDTLKEKNKTIQKEFEDKLKANQLNFALENALTKAKAKNIKTVKALLDTENIKLNEKGELEGLDEQIKTIKESDGYLFTSTVSGVEPGNKGVSSVGSNNPFSKEHFNLTEQGKLLRENPQMAKVLQEQAK